jgi:M6 family metalloprotease-like protein
MPHRALALLSTAGLLALPACSDAGPHLDAPDGAVAATGIGATTAGLSLYVPNPQGNLSIVTPPEEGWFANDHADRWTTIDALSGVAHAHAGDSLEVGVSAEIQTNTNAFFRALIDGKPASPSDTLFEWADTNTWDGVRSFRFVQSNLKAGAHVVEIQWLGGADGLEIRDRTLSLNTASPTSGDARLVVVAGKSGPSIPVEETFWTDIPDLTGQIESTTKGDLRIAFSGEAEATSGTMLVRAVVDSQPTHAVRFTSDADGLEMSSRSFVFRAPNLNAGWHDVRMQWAVAGNNQKGWLGDRTMTLYAAPPAASGGGSVSTGSDVAPAPPGEAWGTLPETVTSFDTVDPSSVIELAVSMEAKAAPGRLFTRVLVDGDLVQPNDVTMVQNVNAWGAYQFTFQLKNVPAGKHSAVVQTMTDPGTTAAIGAHTLTVTSKRRDGADFAQPFRGAVRTMQPRDQVYENIVICFNPHRWTSTAGEAPAPDYAELANTMLGWDNGPSLAGWFAENTDQRLLPGAHHFLGCYDAPEAHQGNWYWANNAFEMMHFDALMEADKWFDFHPFDKNGDGHVTREEALVTIIKPQFDAGGQANHEQFVFLNDGAPLHIHYTDIYWDMTPNHTRRRSANVGVMAHEIGHEILGTRDIYVDQSPQYLSIMATSGGATHLDPAHKLFTGSVLPQVVDIGSWSTGDVQLSAIEKHKNLLVVYDNSRVDEFFLIENRWPDASNYDRLLSVYSNEYGVIVWRVTRDWFTDWWGIDVLNTPLGVLRTAGDEVTLRWSNHATAYLTVQALGTAPEEHTTVRLIK